MHDAEEHDDEIEGPPEPRCPGGCGAVWTGSSCPGCGWQPGAERTPRPIGEAVGSPHGVGEAVAWFYDEALVERGWYRVTAAWLRCRDGLLHYVWAHDVDIPF